MKTTLFTTSLVLAIVSFNLNGQVGIGIAIPTKDLDINGELRIRTLPTAATSDYLLTTDTNGNIRAASTDQLKADISSQPWYLEGSTTTRASANGDKMWHQDFIGIFPNSGNAFTTTTPTNVPIAPLHIKGSINVLTLQDHNDTGGGNINVNFTDSSGASIATIYTGGAANGTSPSGNITVESTSANVRLKTGSHLAVLDSGTGNFTLSGGGTFVPDYVFQKEFDGYSSINNDYSKMSLNQVEDFIKTNYHLPGVDSNAKVQEEGLVLNKMLLQVLEKVEELYLHTIELNKNTIELNKRVEALEKNQER